MILLTSAPVWLQVFFFPADLGQKEGAIRLAVLALFCVPFVYWAYAFHFSERARRYFAQTPDL